MCFTYIIVLTCIDMAIAPLTPDPNALFPLSTKMSDKLFFSCGRDDDDDDDDAADMICSDLEDLILPLLDDRSHCEKFALSEVGLRFFGGVRVAVKNGRNASCC